MNLFTFFSKILNNRASVSTETSDKIRRDWANINNLLKGKSPSQLRQALITADKTLDNALREIVDGKTLGERLINAKNKFDPITYNKLWDAHKIRNNLVHEADYEPPYFVLEEAVNKLKRGLIELHVKL